MPNCLAAKLKLINWAVVLKTNNRKSCIMNAKLVKKTFVTFVSMKSKKRILVVVLLLALFQGWSTLPAQALKKSQTPHSVRSEYRFEKGWKFTREDQVEFAAVAFNATAWQSVTVPHDWAIYGPFSIHNDQQHTAIQQDGQTEAMEHAGRTGGLPFVGTGWYRLRFEVPDFKEGKKATLLFDGAMSQAQVYLNGQAVGQWPSGYNSFYFDVTPYLLPGQENVLAVRLLLNSVFSYKPCTMAL